MNKSYDNNHLWTFSSFFLLTGLGRLDVDVRSVIDDFGELVYRKIDYVAEATNVQRFSELYAGVADVFVLKVYGHLTTRRVLTMSCSPRRSEWPARPP